MNRTLRAISLVGFLLLGTLQAEEPFQASPDCTLSFSASFSAFQKAEPEDWDLPSNIFSQSLPYMLPSALGTLVAAQYVKHFLWMDASDPVFSSAFPITVAADLLTTLTSHGIALSSLPILQKLFKNNLGFWQRAGVNTILGTALINLTWLGAGLDVGASEACAALALCSVVYPTLQALKTKLYLVIPIRRDKVLLDALAARFPEEYALLKKAAREQFDKRAGAGDKLFEHLLLSSLESALTRNPIEKELSAYLVESDQELSVLRGQIFDLEKGTKSLKNIKALRSYLSKQQTLRRKILNRLLDRIEKEPMDSQLYQTLFKHLNLGSRLNSEFVLELHRVLRQRLVGYQGRLALATAVDMSISIGFFGGVCLEHLNLMVASGQL